MDVFPPDNVRVRLAAAWKRVYRRGKLCETSLPAFCRTGPGENVCTDVSAAATQFSSTNEYIKRIYTHLNARRASLRVDKAAGSRAPKDFIKTRGPKRSERDESRKADSNSRNRVTAFRTETGDWSTNFYPARTLPSGRFQYFVDIISISFE